MLEWVPSVRKLPLQKHSPWGEARSFILSTGPYCNSQEIKVTENPISILCIHNLVPYILPFIPPQERVNPWMINSGTPVVSPSQRWGPSQSLSCFWKGGVEHYEWGLRCRRLESSPQLSVAASNPQHHKLCWSGCGVWIWQSPGVGKVEKAAQPILLRHDAG